MAVGFSLGSLVHRSEFVFSGDYSKKRVLITGGLGFIGSNLALRLSALGAQITVLDPCIEHCGGNRANVRSIINSIRLISADISKMDFFAGELDPPDVIFNMAGEVRHLHSMEAPLRDLELNVIAQLAFLKACARHFPGVRIVYAGTRQVYGVPEFLPVTEEHPIQPVDFNGVHKFAACAYHLILSRMGLIDAVVLRLTNVYGPHMALDIGGQGFLSVYLRNASNGQPIHVVGDGKQLRDPVHVDDVIDAFLRAGIRPVTSRVFNISGPEILAIQHIAEIAAEAGSCKIVQRKFTPAEKTIDIGSYYADASRIEHELNWKPRIRFKEGFTAALRLYQAEPVWTACK